MLYCMFSNIFEPGELGSTANKSRWDYINNWLLSLYYNVIIYLKTPFPNPLFLNPNLSCIALDARPLKNKTNYSTKRCVFERCPVSFLWLSLKVEKLHCLRQRHLRPTYLLLLSITAFQRERDTWLYILLSIICSLLYFLLRICLFFLFFFFWYIYSSFVRDLWKKAGVLFLAAEIVSS